MLTLWNEDRISEDLIVGTHNVLCVTYRKLSGWGRSGKIYPLFHQPMSGRVTIERTQEGRVGCWADFEGRHREILYVRVGLTGFALTIALSVNDDPYDVWELYTDTPVARGGKKPVKTPQELREDAEREVRRAEEFRRRT